MFIDNGDGTITDTTTGLMWQQETAPGRWYIWEDALKYCEGLDLAGHTDWRLPNVRELQGIVDHGRGIPVIIDPVFGCWSSSTDVGDPGGAWVVYFGYGYVYDDDKTSIHYVRAVREVNDVH